MMDRRLFYCIGRLNAYFSGLVNSKEKSTLNTDLVKIALDKVTNPNILVNLVSRRVRQLSSGGGGMSRPLIDSAKPLGTADTALEEIVQDKISYERLKEEEMQ